MAVPVDALETERLRLTRWGEDDLGLLTRLSALPDVVRYVGDGRPWTREHAADVAARNLEHWAAHGFGWRVAVERATGTAVGLIALNYAGEGKAGIGPDEHEIGWWLAPSAWGRGLASEGARALRDEALHRVGAPGLIARILPDNLASRRVAEGLGMALDFETATESGKPVLVYRLEATRLGAKGRG